jgi:NAD(P)-dependent dehydrogenase (short-subunit alcohol dehydrogenase family)
VVDSREVNCLAGKTVVITGAGRGLGRAYARHAASEGASVVVNDIAADRAQWVAEEIATAGGDAIAHASTVATYADAKALVDRCLDQHGRIDAFVNNAGRWHSMLPWEETEESIRELVDVNLLGLLYCGAHVLRVMVQQGYGSIVNCASMAIGGAPSQSTYAATKGAIAAATLGWSIDAAPYGVRVNTVLPSANTPLTARASEALPGPEWEPENVAPVVTYLMSDLASAITGQSIRIGGGALSVWARPGPAAPAIINQSWTTEEVADAFSSVLAPNVQHPVAGHRGMVDFPTSNQ